MRCTLALSFLLLHGCAAQPIDSDRTVQSTSDVAAGAEDDSVEETTVKVTPPPKLFDSPLPLATPDLPPGLSHLGAEGCASCHWSVVDSWRHSAHAGKASASLAEAISAADDAPECSRCHLPLQVQHRRLIAPSEEESLVSSERIPNPSWSPSLQAESVGCVACHVRDGVILGSRDLESPHPVRKSIEITQSESCAACHQLTWEGSDLPIYDTFGEWSRSNYAQSGLQCHDCHMAPVAGSATPGGRPTHADHRFNARHGEGLSIHVQLPPEGATRGKMLKGSLRIQNTGAGHAIPTGSPFKRLVVALNLLDSRGKSIGDGAEFRFARNVSPEAPYATLSDNRLQVGDDRSLDFQFELPYRARSGPGTIRVSAFVEHANGEASEDWLVQEIPYPVY